MAEKGLADTIAELSVGKVANLLADRVADLVVAALMKAGFDKQLARALLRSFEEQVDKMDEP